jgi:hypothetical protein
LPSSSPPIPQQLPGVVQSCRCSPMISLNGGGNALTCPLGPGGALPSLPASSLYVLWLYPLTCADPATNIT